MPPYPKPAPGNEVNLVRWATAPSWALGILVTTIMGAVWGFAYLLCGRNLWIVILAHSMAHIALVTQLYLSPPA